MAGNNATIYQNILCALLLLNRQAPIHLAYINTRNPHIILSLNTDRERTCTSFLTPQVPLQQLTSSVTHGYFIG